MPHVTPQTEAENLSHSDTQKSPAAKAERVKLATEIVLAILKIAAFATQVPQWANLIGHRSRPGRWSSRTRHEPTRHTR